MKRFVVGQEVTTPNTQTRGTVKVVSDDGVMVTVFWHEMKMETTVVQGILLPFYPMKATITNLRILNTKLAENGIDITLHETAWKNGKGDTGNTPYRAWGKTIGTARQVMDAMLDTYRILHMTVPKGI